MVTQPQDIQLPTESLGFNIIETDEEHKVDHRRNAQAERLLNDSLESSSPSDSVVSTMNVSEEPTTTETSTTKPYKFGDGLKKGVNIINHGL